MNASGARFFGTRLDAYFFLAATTLARVLAALRLFPAVAFREPAAAFLNSTTVTAPSGYKICRSFNCRRSSAALSAGIRRREAISRELGNSEVIRAFEDIRNLSLNQRT